MVFAQEEVCLEGYVMDTYCINRGYLLDNGLDPLTNPDKHTVHCLVDIPVCRESGFEILADPSANSDVHCRAFKFDDKGNNLYIEFARSQGQCSTCNNQSGIKQGLRATVRGVIKGNGESTLIGELPPTLAVTSVELSSVGCTTQATSPKLICDSAELVPFFYAHGSLMLIGWGLMLPAGVLTAKFGRGILPKGWWFKIHRPLQFCGVIVGLAGFLIAVIIFDVFHGFSSQSLHGGIGIFITILGVGQPLNAYFRPHKQEGHPVPKARVYWEYLHKGNGWTAVTLSVFQIFLGTTILPNSNLAFQIVYILIIVGLAAYVWQLRKRSRPVVLHVNK